MSTFAGLRTLISRPRTSVPGQALSWLSALFESCRLQVRNGNANVTCNAPWSASPGNSATRLLFAGSAMYILASLKRTRADLFRLQAPGYAVTGERSRERICAARNRWSSVCLKSSARERDRHLPDIVHCRLPDIVCLARSWHDMCTRATWIPPNERQYF